MVHLKFLSQLVYFGTDCNTLHPVYHTWSALRIVNRPETVCNVEVEMYAQKKRLHWWSEGETHLLLNIRMPMSSKSWLKDVGVVHNVGKKSTTSGKLKKKKNICGIFHLQTSSRSYMSF